MELNSKEKIDLYMKLIAKDGNPNLYDYRKDRIGRMRMQFIWVPIGVMMGLLVAIAYLLHKFFMWEMPAEIQRAFISQERQDTRLENHVRTAAAAGAVLLVCLVRKIYQRRQDARAEGGQKNPAQLAQPLLNKSPV